MAPIKHEPIEHDCDILYRYILNGYSFCSNENLR